MDLNLSKDVYESYRIFQSKIIEQYESMVNREKFTVVDATLGIKEQQKIMRENVKQLLPPKMIKSIMEIP